MTDYTRKNINTDDLHKKTDLPRAEPKWSPLPKEPDAPQPEEKK